MFYDNRPDERHVCHRTVKELVHLGPQEDFIFFNPQAFVFQYHRKVLVHDLRIDNDQTVTFGDFIQDSSYGIWFEKIIIWKKPTVFASSFFNGLTIILVDPSL